MRRKALQHHAYGAWSIDVHRKDSRKDNVMLHTTKSQSFLVLSCCQAGFFLRIHTYLLNTATRLPSLTYPQVEASDVLTFNLTHYKLVPMILWTLWEVHVCKIQIVQVHGRRIPDRQTGYHEYNKFPNRKQCQRQLTRLL
jgi:hypothetical protein